MTRTRLVFMAVLLAGTSLSLAPDHASAQKKKDRDLITREEIDNSPQKELDIMQVIRSLRPHFLAKPRGVRTLGMTMQNPIVVYVNGTKRGELDVLKEIMAPDVVEVRYFEPAKAQDEFGQDHNGGAIVVKKYEGVRNAPPKPPAR